MNDAGDDPDKTLLRGSVPSRRRSVAPVARPEPEPAPDADAQGRSAYPVGWGTDIVEQPTSELVIHSPGDPLRGGRRSVSPISVGHCAGPLVSAATPLLLLAGRISDLTHVNDPERLQRDAIESMRGFEKACRTAGISNEIIVTARYLLCTLIDEAVQSTPWGYESIWPQQSLLMLFHREAWGGKKFFQIMERAVREPEKYGQLLELIYLCLALGFSGQYKLEANGQSHLDEIRRDLYVKIRDSRPAEDHALSVRWQPSSVQNQRFNAWRFWLTMAGIVGMVAALFLILYVQLGWELSPVRNGLFQIGRPLPPPVALERHAKRRLSLKQLLRSDEESGVLSVEELSDRSIVRLNGAGFGTASADLNAASVEALRHVRAALVQLPGHVYIVGHTDDVPVHTREYKDNYELSLARANACLKILADSPQLLGRFDINGVGSDQPRFTPANLPDNRARNRRVEIIYMEDLDS